MNQNLTELRDTLLSLAGDVDAATSDALMRDFVARGGVTLIDKLQRREEQGAHIVANAK